MAAFEDALKGAMEAQGVPLSALQMEQLSAYCALLQEARRAFNLTAAEDPQELALRHFADSLALPALNLLTSGDTVIDVGSGAGFPGLPIAILRAGLRLTLLDSTAKRTAFLQSVAQALGLGNVEVVTARAEDYARGPGRERFSAALSRAVAPMNVLLEYTLPFVRVGGRVLAWKGPAAPAEIAAAGNACALLGGGAMRLHPYALAGREFCIVETEKIRHTPPVFPRKTGIPSKIPIK
jgi:16S rRNA (guanine527-N7)-methyltransferase